MAVASADWVSDRSLYWNRQAIACIHLLSVFTHTSMSGDVQMASTESPAPKAWAPPPELPRQQVLPDRESHASRSNTGLSTRADIANALGKESDPTR
jgi:hypothetical protein